MSMSLVVTINIYIISINHHLLNLLDVFSCGLESHGPNDCPSGPRRSRMACKALLGGQVRSGLAAMILFFWTCSKPHEHSENSISMYIIYKETYVTGGTYYSGHVDDKIVCTIPPKQPSPTKLCALGDRKRDFHIGGFEPSKKTPNQVRDIIV